MTKMKEHGQVTILEDDVGSGPARHDYRLTRRKIRFLREELGITEGWRHHDTE